MWIIIIVLLIRVGAAGSAEVKVSCVLWAVSRRQGGGDGWVWSGNEVPCHVFSITTAAACGHVDTAEGKDTRK